ncbi:MAG: DUF6267 family protein, partial [Candidatus Dormibacteria bacterium]
LLSHLSHIDTHHESYKSALEIHHHMRQAKNVLIDRLDMYNGYKTTHNGEETPGEGFVVTHHGTPSKLVNRHQFSKLNFEHAKSKTIKEGGNIKVGEHAAQPISTHDRPTLRNDIKNTLVDIHNSFHKVHGVHLFGQHHAALTHAAYSGSTHHVMNHAISDSELHHHKPTIGDVDVKVPKEHAAALKAHLTPGKKFGPYHVVGVHGHGTETTALMKHRTTGHVHQFDFEHSDYHQGMPTKGAHLAHNSPWSDVKHGIGGVHHKILLHVAGREHMKYSATHGVRSKTDPNDVGAKEPEHVTHKLFGPTANHHDIYSFHGLASLIKKHIPAAEHADIYNKFKEAIGHKPHTEHSHALTALRHHLDLKDD